jgi:hypothetical protein
VENSEVTGVRTYSNAVYPCKAAIICTGTYLKARCIYGDVSTFTGPNGLPAANHLTDCLKNLGFTEDILPKNQNYNAICILGSTSPSMHDRMDFIEKLVANNKIFLESCKFFLLTGERYVSYVDGKDEDLVAIGEKMGVKKEMLTEALLLQNIFNNSPLSKRVESVLINTPMKNGFRPTTKTTVQEFCQ